MRAVKKITSSFYTVLLLQNTLAHLQTSRRISLPLFLHVRNRRKKSPLILQRGAHGSEDNYLAYISHTESSTEDRTS